MSYNISARVTRDCLCSGEFVPAQKNSRRVRGSLTAGIARIPVDFDVCHRPTYADGTRHERFGASLGKLARDETTVLTTKLEFFSLSLSLCLVMFPSRSLIYPSSETSSVGSTSFANYPSPGTLISHVRRRTRQEERDLNVFGPEGCHFVCSQRSHCSISVCILRLSVHTKIHRAIQNNMAAQIEIISHFVSLQQINFTLEHLINLSV